MDPNRTPWTREELHSSTAAEARLPSAAGPRHVETSSSLFLNAAKTYPSGPSLGCGDCWTRFSRSAKPLSARSSRRRSILAARLNRPLLRRNGQDLSVPKQLVRQSTFSSLVDRGNPADSASRAFHSLDLGIPDSAAGASPKCNGPLEATSMRSSCVASPAVPSIPCSR